MPEILPPSGTAVVGTPGWRFLIGALSLVLNAVACYFLYRYSEHQPGWLRLMEWVAVGGLAGVVFGRIFGRGHHRTIGAGAFAGMLLLWTPVVLNTYGFALIAVPILMAYGVIAGLGARHGGR